LDTLTITRELDAAPLAILSAVELECREWRESSIPPELRARGVLRVVARVDGSRFELYFEGGEGRMGTVRLEGSVSASTNISVVKARVRRAGTARPAAAVVLAIGLISLIRGDDVGWFLVLLAVPIGALAWFQLGTIPDWMAPRARYLVTRLNAALDRVGRSVPEPDARY
jgi:hypothetical protein